MTSAVSPDALRYRSSASSRVSYQRTGLVANASKPANSSSDHVTLTPAATTDAGWTPYRRGRQQGGDHPAVGVADDDHPSLCGSTPATASATAE